MIYDKYRGKNTRPECVKLCTVGYKHSYQARQSSVFNLFVFFGLQFDRRRAALDSDDEY
jgi:hypothetical protein